VTPELLVFAVTTVAAVISALYVVLHRNPVVNAVALIVNLACIAVFFALLNAPFLAAVQVIVYAGAIMVLFLFVIMLLDLRTEMHRVRGGAFQRGMAILGAGTFLVLLGTALRRTRLVLDATSGRTDVGTVEEIARSLLTEHVIAFELASVLLLVAMVGALVLAKAFLSEGGQG